ncbi:MAG: ELWxxDGT repeat protein [Chitinophagaceae bacterium]
MKKLFILFLLTGFLKTNAQHFSLLKDINPGSATSNIGYLTDVNNILFFAANDGVNGMELWKSDGTSGGTVLVKDIRTGSGSSSIGYLTDVNGTLFFVANNGTQGTELWKSDGTEAGTVIVKDIRSGSLGSNPSGLVNISGTLFFAADNGIQGTELWKSDGTVAGTVIIKDINLNSASSNPQSLVNVNGTLFFAADNGVQGTELWKSDGTSAGTILVKDIWNGSPESYPFDLAAVGNTVYFSANNGSQGTELWKSDGSAGGTTLVKDVWTGISDGYPFDLVNVGGTLFFSADNGANGIELWKSDGTPGGTTLVKDVWPGSSSGAVGNFSKFINKLVFTGNDGETGYKTWQSDGTSSGTQIATGVVDIGTGTIQELVETDAKIFASINDGVTGSELWFVSFSSVLPLELLELKAELIKMDGIVSWKTTNEINTSEFLIERSLDGNNYTTVGRVTASNSQVINNYKFTDKDIIQLRADIVYYRLKQIDIDSRFTYSKVVALTVKGDKRLSFYPNPATNELNLVTGNISEGKLQYKIFDNSGKLVLQGSKQITGGSSSVDINKLATGIYYIDLYTSALNERMQFVKH